MLLKPATVEEVSAILKLASETGTAVVPQTGNTGLVGGQTPREGQSDIILSLERMNKIRDVDPVANVLVADGGAILAEVQKAAEAHGGCFRCRSAPKAPAASAATFPPMPAAPPCWPTATCASSASGSKWCCRPARSGTAAPPEEGQYRLRPARPLHRRRRHARHHHRRRAEALSAAARPAGGLCRPQLVEDALALFNLASSLCGTSLTGFELMPRFGVEITARHIDGVRDPLESEHPWYVLIDISTSDSAETAERMMTALLEQGFEAGLVQDAVIASSSPAEGAVAHARKHVGCAEAGRRVDQARRVRAGLDGTAVHAGGRRSGDGGHARRPHLRLRPHGRRQYPLQHLAAGRRRQAGISSAAGTR
jgi:hypothetical protein